MEELGIGRPSTYASILQVLKDRNYVRIDKRRLVPEDRGRIVIAFLESFFARYVEYDFTADLEEQLDRVSNNEVEWRELLRQFWTGFIGAVGEIKDLQISQVIDALDAMLAPHLFPPRADGVDPRVCTTCGTGRLSLKLGKFGAFIGCSNYPECKFTRPFSVPGADGVEDTGTRPLGRDPNGVEVTLRNGRFGPYVQLGEAAEGEKPKRASLLRGTDPAAVDLEMALKLLSLPREVGRHPESGEPIVAGVGRYGPYIQHGKTYANIETGDDVFNIGLNRAVTLIAEKIAKGPRGRFGGDPGRSLGDHPDKGGAVLVKNGRYGPYVTHDGVNATLPSDKTPETITLDEAVVLLAARAERTGGKPARRGKAAKPASGKAVRQGGKAEKTHAAKGKASPPAPRLTVPHLSPPCPQSQKRPRRPRGRRLPRARPLPSRPPSPHRNRRPNAPKPASEGAKRSQEEPRGAKRSLPREGARLSLPRKRVREQVGPAGNSNGRCFSMVCRL